MSRLCSAMIFRSGWAKVIRMPRNIQPVGLVVLRFSGLKQSPLQQCLHIAAVVRDHHDVNTFGNASVDDAVGFETLSGSTSVILAPVSKSLNDITSGLVFAFLVVKKVCVYRIKLRYSSVLDVFTIDRDR